MVDRVKPLRRFEDLDIWQRSQDLAVHIYVITKTFPETEKFGLTSQLRRASASISANIAEGFGRHSQKDKLHFYTIAYGSILEVRNFLYLANRINFIVTDKLQLTLQETEICQKLLNALMTSVRRTT